MKTSHIFIAFAAGAAALLAGCSDTWDEHYDPEGSTQATNENLLEVMEKQPELSTFVKMIEEAGYGDMLRGSQTLTVFAPTNEALAGVDMADIMAVRRVVANHIARFNCSTSTPSSQSVKMLNGKRCFFTASSFGGADIAQADIRTHNGLLHILSAQIPYKYNIREYIDTHAETSQLSAFIGRFDTREFSETQGSDSLWVDYNPLFDHEIYGLGAIASEDSTFTMLVPDNRAWDEAYQQMLPHFKSYDADAATADSLQALQASLAIVDDLIFRQEFKAGMFPTGVTLTTAGSEITDVASMFAGAQPLEASNGMIYTASALGLPALETWSKPVEVEGEEPSGRTPGAGTNANVRVLEGANPFASQVSEMKYLEITSMSPSRQPGVSVSLPQVLAGSYDIYVAVVPACAADTTNTTESTRLQFTLSYLNDKGRNATKTFKLNTFTTSPTEMTYIQVAESFSFPVSNYYDRLWLCDPSHSEADRKVTTSLLISTNVSNTEFNKGTLARRFRLDRVILVPTF